MKKGIYGKMKKDYFRENYLSKDVQKGKEKYEEENEGKLQ